MDVNLKTSKYFVFVFMMFFPSMILANSNQTEPSEIPTRYLLSHKPNCSYEHQKRIEIKIAKMMPLGEYARKLPENYKQARYYCKESVRLVKETERFFHDCYKKDMVELAKIIIFSIKHNIRLYCKRKTKRLQKLLEIAPCVNKNIHHAQKCIDGFMNNTKQLINFNVDKDKIKYACCNYVEGMRCAEEQIDEKRNDGCTGEGGNKELILDSVRGITGNFVNFACGDFDEVSSKCEQLGPQPVLNKPNNKHYYTPVFILVDLMESMKSFQSLS